MESNKNIENQKDIKKILSLPVKFEDDNQNNILDPDRFFKLKLYYATIGKNLNSSSISQQVYDDAKSTLEFIPILAYMKNVTLENGDEQPDFTTHEMECVPVVDEDGNMVDWKLKYLEQPIGFVPPSYMNNYHYELDSTSGLTYAVVDAYIYKVYCQDAIDVLVKNQKQNISMEIKILDDDYDFSTNTLVINQMKYLGITVLSNLTATGMEGARAEVAAYSNDNKFALYSNMLEEFKTEYAKFEKSKESNEESVIEDNSCDIEKNNKEDYEVNSKMEEVKNEVLETSEEFKKAKTPETPVEDTEAKEEMAKAEKPTEKEPDDKTVGEVLAEETPKDVETNAKKEEDKASAAPVEEPDGDEDECEMSLDEAKAEYESKISELNSKISEYETKVSDFGKVIVEKDEAYASLNEKFEKLTADYEEVSSKYSTIEKENKEKEVAKVFAKFASKLVEDEVKELKEAAMGLSVSELEDKLFALVGKKALTANFSASVESNMDKSFKMAVDVPLPKAEVKDEKPYAEMVKKYSKK